MEVTTNGSMTPKDAVKDAAEILIRYLSIFTDIDAADLALRPDGGAVEAAAPSAHGMENILIEELELGVRSYNCLKRVGIETIGDLISKSEAELAAIPNFGKKSIEEVKETLATHGLRLRGDEGVAE
jgi:DNA-directed RNA polymerase subunit alpha